VQYGELSQYRILSTLWHGESSIVYMAVDPMDKYVTLKTLLPTAPNHRQALRRMRHEARIARKLNHPHITRIYQYVSDVPQPCLVMEFFPGDNLKIRMVRKDAVLQERMLNIIWDGAQALHYLHQRRILHRDIKPENFIVGDDGTTKLTDFAIAVVANLWWRVFLKYLESKTPGTRMYMSPEALLKQPIDHRTDVYSFGCTMYELVTRQPPFAARGEYDLSQKQLHEKPIEPKRFVPDIDPELENLILQMMRKAPGDRPASMAEVMSRLSGLDGFQAISAKSFATDR